MDFDFDKGTNGGVLDTDALIGGDDDMDDDDAGACAEFDLDGDDDDALFFLSLFCFFLFGVFDFVFLTGGQKNSTLFPP